ncbi:hypothetical protein [Pelomicrobium methylotrophicum]|uniref:Uncharacterized protein n=1 Tax=Pelomicrobium methylotrophicum TaxID=2602750 RepID=A0A5C7EMT0_9PROT|nr:hypothetical protein [Pelomicrobium methylotrophicum]TXF12909.1 hypothetical protein FR698_04585 [Pelomicrobium methylotrophicum]
MDAFSYGNRLRPASSFGATRNKGCSAVGLPGLSAITVPAAPESANALTFNGLGRAAHRAASFNADRMSTN